MSDLNLFHRIVDLVGSHQLLSLIGALVLGLIAPASLRRFARGTVVVAFWVAVLIYLLPVGALWLAFRWSASTCSPTTICPVVVRGRCGCGRPLRL